MPHLMNCGHSDDGWCLDCVKAQHAEITDLRARLAAAEAVVGRAERIDQQRREQIARLQITVERLQAGSTDAALAAGGGGASGTPPPPDRAGPG
jgi:fatty acid/phospholipid biosynthesis enzyme